MNFGTLLAAVMVMVGLVVVALLAVTFIRERKRS